MKTPEERIKEALNFAFEYAQIDGAHHKMWTIDQMVRKLCGSDEAYKKWVKEYSYDEETEETYEWDKGIAP